MTATQADLDSAGSPPSWSGKGGIGAVGRKLAYRSVLHNIRMPSAIIPTLLMPIFFVVAFSGTFSGIASIPGFPTDNILDWMAPYAIMQGAAFAGMGAGFGVARDLETGFYDRLLAAPAPRVSLLTGPVIYTSVRSFVPVVLVLIVAYIGGARMVGGILGFVTLVIAALGVAAISGFWGLGVAYRAKTQRSMALTQVGIFVVMFLSIGMVPLGVMEGWLHEVAQYNPFTNVLRMARQGFIGDVTWSLTWPGLLALLGGLTVLGLFAAQGFRKIIP